MVTIKDVSFRYQNSQAGALENLSLRVEKGQCVLLCGRSGCGKTTITRLINGLIPHFYEGELGGEVFVNGLAVREAELYETACHVGSVFQNPRSQFFCVDTTSEIAFGCENMGIAEEEVTARVEASAKELHMTGLLGRSIFRLSGGEKQKVACASVAALQPDVFVLDEPTSNLDMEAIADLKKTLLLWKGQGKTIIIAEHRLYWLLDICDRVINMDGGQIRFDLPMGEFLSFSDREAAALGLRALHMDSLSIPCGGEPKTEAMELLQYRFFRDKRQTLNIPALYLPVGGVIAVIGRNGAGKSTFMRCLSGLERGFRGTVTLNGTVCGPRSMLKKCYMVMQDVNHQLFCESVLEEVQLGMREENASRVQELLEGLGLLQLAQRHPMSLSGGQKQRVAIACALLAEKEILIFDEPTSGLDFEHMEQTAKLLLSLKGQKTLFIITHDPELIVRCCTRILHLEGGAVVENYELTQDRRTQFFGFFKDGAQSLPGR